MIKTVAVLGAGTMGHGIAHAAMAGRIRDAHLRHLADAAVDKGSRRDRADHRKGVELGKMSQGDRRRELGRG